MTGLTDVPPNCRLLPIDYIICNTWIVRIEHQTLYDEFTLLLLDGRKARSDALPSQCGPF
jgi:hypothetical protein